MNTENANQWKELIKKELKNFYGNNAMKIVENQKKNKRKNIPKGIKPLLVKYFFFTIKDNDIYKTKLVVRGFRQIKGVDYPCTYSPTIEMDSF